MTNAEFCETLTMPYLNTLKYSDLQELQAKVKSFVDHSLAENNGYMNMECEYVFVQKLYGISEVMHNLIVNGKAN